MKGLRNSTLVRGAQSCPPSFLKEKSVLLVFAADWCIFCRKLVPLLSSWYREHHTQDSKWEAILVSGDREKSDFDGFAKSFPFPFLAFDCMDVNDGLTREFQVEAVPTLIIIDKFDKIVSRNALSLLSEQPEKLLQLLSGTMQSSIGGKAVDKNNVFDALMRERQVEEAYFDGLIDGLTVPASVVRKTSMKFDAEGDFELLFETENHCYAIIVLLQNQNKILHFMQCQALANAMHIGRRGGLCDNDAFHQVYELLRAKYHDVRIQVQSSRLVVTVKPDSTECQLNNEQSVLKPIQCQSTETGGLDFFCETTSNLKFCFRLHFMAALENGFINLSIKECQACAMLFNFCEPGDRIDEARLMKELATLRKELNFVEIQRDEDILICDIVATSLENPMPMEPILQESISAEHVSAYPGVEMGEMIASSGQATVHQGKYEGKDVAIKIFHEDDNASYKTELKSLLKLGGHPNVVEILDFFDSPAPCLVMPLIRGGSLMDFLKNQPEPLSTPKAVDIILGIAYGLDHLHASGYVHRDMKSPNIMMNDEDCPVIIDMGLGSAWNPGTERKSKVGAQGTLFWMAPEMISSALSSDKTDVYAFAIIMWEVLSKRLPYSDLNMKFDRSFQEKVAHKMLRPTLKFCGADRPAYLIEAIQYCWAESPDERPSMRAVIELLEGAGGVEFRDPVKLFRKVLNQRQSQAGAGEMRFVHFLELIEILKPNHEMPNDSILELFRSIDLDEGGTISMEEFLKWWSLVESSGLEKALQMKRIRKRLPEEDRRKTILRSKPQSPGAIGNNQVNLATTTRTSTTGLGLSSLDAVSGVAEAFSRLERVLLQEAKKATSSVFPVIGSDLTTCMERQKGDFPSLPVPFLLVRYAADIFRLRGEMEEGLFRLSPLVDDVEGQIFRVNTEGNYDLVRQDPHLAAAMIKRYLRDLPSPIFDNYAKAISLVRKNCSDGELLDFLREQPQASQAVVKFLGNLLFKLSLAAQTTKMTPNAYAIVFAPGLLRSPSVDATALQNNDSEIQFSLRMLTTVRAKFPDDSVGSVHSVPLPLRQFSPINYSSSFSAYWKSKRHKKYVSVNQEFNLCFTDEKTTLWSFVLSEKRDSYNITARWKSVPKQMSSIKWKTQDGADLGGGVFALRPMGSTAELERTFSFERSGRFFISRREGHFSLRSAESSRFVCAEAKALRADRQTCNDWEQYMLEDIKQEPALKSFEQVQNQEGVPPVDLLLTYSVAFRCTLAIGGKYLIWQGDKQKIALSSSGKPQLWDFVPNSTSCGVLVRNSDSPTIFWSCSREGKFILEGKTQVREKAGSLFQLYRQGANYFIRSEASQHFIKAEASKCVGTAKTMGKWEAFLLDGFQQIETLSSKLARNSGASSMATLPVPTTSSFSSRNASAPLPMASLGRARSSNSVLPGIVSTSTKIEDMSLDQLCSMLQTMKVTDATLVFLREQNIDGSVLHMISEEDLNAFKIPFGDKLRLKKLITP